MCSTKYGARLAPVGGASASGVPRRLSAVLRGISPTFDISTSTTLRRVRAPSGLRRGS
jgi:hypothetical protein